LAGEEGLTLDEIKQLPGKKKRVAAKISPLVQQLNEQIAESHVLRRNDKVQRRDKKPDKKPAKQDV
jgi:hypothetical protein